MMLSEDVSIQDNSATKDCGSGQETKRAPKGLGVTYLAVTCKGPLVAIFKTCRET